MPALIEVQQREVLKDLPLFIKEMKIPNISEQHLSMFRVLGLNHISKSINNDLTLIIQDKELRIEDLV